MPFGPPGSSMKLPVGVVINPSRRGAEGELGEQRTDHAAGGPGDDDLAIGVIFDPLLITRCACYDVRHPARVVSA